jgi:hypothetical protein
MEEKKVKPPELSKANLPKLTEEEIELLNLSSQGYSKKGIAKRLRKENVDVRTVERIFDNIEKKFSKIDGRLGRKKGLVGEEDEIGYTGRNTIVGNIYREYYLNHPIFFVRRRDIRFEMDITENQILIETQVDIQSLSEQPLPFITHGLILDDQSPDADGSHEYVNASTMAPGVTARAETVINNPKTPRFRVYFDPPLKLGDFISYHYSIKSKNYFPMSREEIKKRIDKGHYHLKDVICETTYTISTPTDHLYLQLTFPSFFEIEDEHVKVEVSRSGPQNQEEEQRIQHPLVLTKNLFGPRTRLVFDLKQPILNHRYRIRWRPCK